MSIINFSFSVSQFYILNFSSFTFRNLRFIFNFCKFPRIYCYLIIRNESTSKNFEKSNLSNTHLRSENIHSEKPKRSMKRLIRNCFLKAIIISNLILGKVYSRKEQNRKRSLPWHPPTLQFLL